jgi:hypothetical protein
MRTTKSGTGQRSITAGLLETLPAGAPIWSGDQPLIL